jgi:hypothetical protein
MAYARGLLTGPDLNTLQEMCLETYLLRQKIEQISKEERDFENLLFLNRPEVYQEYIKNKEEAKEYGFDRIDWKQPETAEELEMILSAINSVDESEEQESQEDYSKEQEFLAMFDGIDISQLGEDDG